MLLRATVLSLLIASPVFAAVSTSPPASGAPSLDLIVFAPPPREATCAGGRATPVLEAAALHPRAVPTASTIAPVIASLAPSEETVVTAKASKDDVLTFAIDADGRPTDIRKVGPGRSSDASDPSIAALASWRFASGAPASGCQVALTSQRVPLVQARRADLLELIAFERRNTPPAVREAVSKVGDCGLAPRRLPKTIAYPDLRRFNDRDLNPAWAAVTYDIDADGAPRDVRVETQSGDPALADAAAAAIAGSRFQPGKPVKACYGTFAATPRDTPAPPRPTLTSFERPGDKCDVTKAALNLPAAKNYPRAYAARKVAGWAYLRFDVAPWGQVGNVEVLASEPSAAFGEAARGLLWSAHPAAPAEGYRGCIVPVVYAIPDPEPIFD
ncbi:energy transducer TonB [Caulobacter soli]|uniref:energy transducer TonB n=1 Tax=Caulobacter soli TaxID=2708539 RepID=UPI0013EA4537|nr:TonB family protein [Caulobacter soli]